MKKKIFAAGMVALSLLFPGTAIASAPNGWYTIQTKSSPLNRISIEDSNQNTPALIKKAGNDTKQKFLLTKLSDGTYKIGTGITIGNSVLTGNGNIIQQKYANNNNQKWKIIDNTDSYSFQNTNSGKLITVKNNQLTEEKSNNSNSQKFILNKVIEKYTVIFTDGFGKILKRQSVKKGESATAPSNPSKSGYTFNGWDTNYSSITKSTTINAKWTKNTNTYTVTFTDGQGKTLKTQTVEKGKGATAPSNPTRTGYVFNGWDKTFSNITGNLTVNAKWTAKQSKVVFHINIPNDTRTYTETYTYGAAGQTFGMKLGDKSGAFGMWKRDGYTLLGWAHSNSATTKNYYIYSGVDDGWIDSHTGTVDLYAVWQKNSADIKDGWYTISPTLNSGYALDVNGNTTGNGTNVQLWKKNNSDAQKFFIHKIDADTYTILTGTPGYNAAIDIDAGKSHGNAQQWAFENNNNQKWRIEKTSNGYMFYNKANGQVLDIEGNDTLSDGKNIWTYEYLANDKGQTFTLASTTEPASVAGKKRIIFKGTNKVVNIKGVSALDKAEAIVYDNKDENNSKFALEKVSEGIYHIRALNSDRYLLEENGKIVQSRGTSTAFRWQTVWNGDGSVSFKNVSSGKFLYASATTNGTQLTTINSNTDAKTRFNLPSTDYVQVIANGTYLIKSGAGQYLTTEYNNWNNGTKIAGATSYTDIKKGMRLFRVTYLGDGNYRFETGSSIFKSSIDLPNNVDTAGTKPQQYTTNNVAAQKFHIIGSGNGDWRISHNAMNIQTTTDTDPCTMQPVSTNAAQKMTFTKANGWLIQDTYKYYFPETGTKPQMAIDVSKWQENIDWAKVKATGRVDFAVVRMLNHDTSTTTGVDPYALRNLTELEKQGIPYGVYWYSMATTQAQLKTELDALFKHLGSHKPTKGIWFDVEAVSTYNNAWGSNWQTTSAGKEKLTALIKYAKSYIEGKGFEAGLYLNPGQISAVSPTSFGMKWWVPRYYGNSTSDTSLINHSSGTYKGAYMWQWSDQYTLSGVNGSRVDMDCVLYDDNYVYNGSTLVKKNNNSDSIVTYNVTFTDGQGKTLKTESVNTGSNAIAPNNPTRTGYTFAGWDKSFTNVTGNITVNAKWTPKTVKVIFNINSDKTWTYTETYTYGVTGQSFGMKLSNRPGDFGDWSRSGYKLLGWSKNANAATASWTTYSGVTDGWIEENAGTVNLYAIWSNGSKNGWVKENNAWYYYKNGVKYTGWHEMGANEGETTKHYSYFGTDGKLVTGWFTADTGYEKLRYADANGWVYGPAGFKTNVATTPNVGVTKFKDGSTGTLNGSYYFNDKGELTQVIYNNFTHLNQRSYFATSSVNYGNGCGPVSGLMAANMMGKLTNYVGSTYKTSSDRYSASAAFRSYMNTWQESTGNTYVGRSGGSNGVWNYQIKNNLVYWHDVNAEYIEDNNMYSSARIQGILTWGRVGIPFCNVKLDGSYAKHFMVVNGWRLKDGAVQYHVVDPYGNTKLDPNCAGQNDGWYSVSGMESITYKGSGKESYSDTARAVRNFTVVGTRMKFGY